MPLPSPLIEIVPNLSEGRRPGVVAQLAQTLQEVTGVVLLDTSTDARHHRTVLTAVGSATALEEASRDLARTAVERIDLRRHRGVHPRMGALDVLPFVPLRGAEMADCVELAHRVGRRLGDELALPVFLYGAAARRPERSNLADVRRGGFEGLAAKLTLEAWRPDYGPSTPHPTAGAVAVGARGLLVAFNVVLDTDRLDIARGVARQVRESSGGLPGVKAIGVELDDEGRVQVSMNLVEPLRTTPLRAFRAVSAAAAERRIGVVGSEIVGLAPRAALADTTAEQLKLPRKLLDVELEERLRRAEERLDATPVSNPSEGEPS